MIFYIYIYIYIYIYNHYIGRNKKAYRFKKYLYAFFIKYIGTFDDRAKYY